MGGSLWAHRNDRENARRYRQRADAYLDMANRAAGKPKRALLDLAQTYCRLAYELENGIGQNPASP
jgi:hypothetical protein